MRVEIQRQVRSVGEPPEQPPVAVVLIVTPSNGQVRVQWPPDMPVAAVVQVLEAGRQAVAGMARAPKGGLVLPEGAKVPV